MPNWWQIFNVNSVKEITRRFASLRLTLALLLLLALTSAVGTFLPQGKDQADYIQMFGNKVARLIEFLALGDMYHSAWYRSILSVLFLNMAACMLTRLPAAISSLRGEGAMRRSPVVEAASSRSLEEDLVSKILALGYTPGKGERARVFSRGGAGYVCTIGAHLSLLVIVLFSLSGSTLGFIGTQRVFVGDSTGTFFNWKTLSDDPLPFTLNAEEFTRVPHPIALRIGIRETDTGKKRKLITTHVGDDFGLPGVAGRVEILGFDTQKKEIRALWTDSRGKQFEIGAGEQIGETGLSIVPVAFAQFPEKQAIARTSLVRDGTVVASEDVEVNHPLRYEGLAIFLTDYGVDPFGLPYVGYQIVKDPGQWGVWTGSVLFLVFVTGAIFIRHRCVVVADQDGILGVYVSSRGDRDKVVGELLAAIGVPLPEEVDRGAMEKWSGGGVEK